MSASGNEDPLGTVDLVGHTVIDTEQLADVRPDNLVVRAKSPVGRWIEEATEQVGPARARFRSTYFHWALALNGLHVAAERYRDPSWHGSFTITGARTDGAGLGAKVVLAQWSGPKAADAHMATAPKLCAWGFIELYAVLESFVFTIYRIFLAHHPDVILRGEEFRELRRMKRAAEADPAQRETWDQAFKQRLDAWHRKKLYDGLERVFLALFTSSGLRAPSSFKATTPETWSETIHALGLVRHLLVHGESVVPKGLGELCTKPHTLSLGFKTGDRLHVSLHHLQAFELFTEQLLSAINLSLGEHADAGA